MHEKIIKECIKNNNFEWRKHALIRMAERDIAQNDILKVILQGEIIEMYPNDTPYPSCLMLGKIREKIYHVVIALDEADKFLYIITAYEPSIKKFDILGKKRR